MKSGSTGRLLSTVFVDYDNIYMSLKRKSEEAAKAFAKNAPTWLKEIESGRLITPTNGPASDVQRRIVMNRCYGNPVPRRNQSDNSTDMNSFPFVRHNFLRAGFEVIDCPPLTAQLKNSADIRMVMDVRDFISHDTYFDEFVMLSGDADFTPLLHRLRAHARRTIVFANDYTASPYTALSDGEIRESDLIAFLVEGRLPGEAAPQQIAAAEPIQQPALPSASQIEIARRDIIAEVVASVRMSPQPVPLEALADRAVRNLGHEKTAGSAWGGAGTFRELLQRALPQQLRLSEQAPYYVYDMTRQAPAEAAQQPRIAAPAPRSAAPAPSLETFETPSRTEPRYDRQPIAGPRTDMQPPMQAAPPFAQAPQQAPGFQGAQPQHAGAPPPLASLQPAAYRQHSPYEPRPAEPMAHAPQQPAAPAPQQRSVPQQQPQQRPAETASAIQKSIARIHDACQAPPLSPPEYRALFEVMAQEITANGLLGAQTLASIGQRAQELGVELKRDDVRFVLEVVSEADPWFEQGASASLFAGRFRNFVVARCRSQGLNLTADELDLIEAWFAAAPGQARAASPTTAPRASNVQAPPQQSALQQAAPQQSDSRWWSLDDGRGVAGQGATEHAGEELPRIVRARQRG